MKRKGFCFERAVSLLLAAVMILTAAPQTSLTALAAEDSDISVNQQVLSVEDTLADEESNDKDADGDAAQPEDDQSGDDSMQPPTDDGEEEFGDGSESGGDVLPEDPEQTETPDDAEEPEEVTEPADEQEGDGEDAADIEDEEETVSENTLAAELMEEDNESKEDSDTYKDLVDVQKDQDDNGWKYASLTILGDNNDLADAKIEEILNSYKDKERFECVRIKMNDPGSNRRVIKKNILNAAYEIMKTDHPDPNIDEDDEGRYWIEFIFTTNGDENNSISFTLFRPNGTAQSDISANVTLTAVAGQGVKVKFPAVNFPAKDASVWLRGSAYKPHITCLYGEADEDDNGWNEIRRYSILTMVSGKPTAVVPGGWIDVQENEMQVGNIGSLKAAADYLIVPVKTADTAEVTAEVTAGGTVKLRNPEGTNVTWKSYTPDIVSVNSKDGETILSAWNEGEALYGVSYKAGTVQKADFYRVRVVRKLIEMVFDRSEITMEKGEEKHLQLYYTPEDAGCDQENPEEINWKITAGNDVIVLGRYNENGEFVTNSPNGTIKALKAGTATVTATYAGDDKITATCTVTVKEELSWDDVESEFEAKINNKLYAVSGCDTTLSDVKFPAGVEGWAWKNPETSLAPYAGTEGHDFPVICKKGDKTGNFQLYVRMINVSGVAIKSRNPGEGNAWSEWGDQWSVPTDLKTGSKLSLGVVYDLENIPGIQDSETGEWQENLEIREAVEKKLGEKYSVAWSSAPANLGTVKDDGTYEYTASVSGSQAEKKTFTVSVKDKNKVLWKASHTLTVITEDLFDWNKIQHEVPEQEWPDMNIELVFNEENGKLEQIKLRVEDTKPEEYNRSKLTFESLDTGILQLNTKKTAVEAGTGEYVKDTVVTIPCTQKNYGRLWIKITAPDQIKSSLKFCIDLHDIQPKILGAATQTINKASSNPSVPVYLSAHDAFPLIKDGVTIQEVKIGGKAVTDMFTLTKIDGNGDTSNSETFTDYAMNLALNEANLSQVRAGTYAVTLKCMVKETTADSTPVEQSVSLTVKVTDVKPKVTFKQTKKVNLFYTDDEGAGTLQINTTEEITKLTLENYTDKNPNKNADCHYELKNVEGVYKIVRKSVQSGAQPDGSLKKGILKYEVAGYAGEFTATFTVATENKAPVIVLSAKSDTLYPTVGYVDSWISMTDKATGEAFIPAKAKWYTGKGQSRDEKDVTIGDFDESEDKALAWSDITGSTSKNKYQLYVKNDGNIVSRLQEIDPKNGKKTDTINLELAKNNWSKPVAVSYKLQVNTAAPKLALGKATLTLNNNDKVYLAQQERTTLRLKGFNDWIRQGDGDYVSFVGQDDKSKSALKRNLAVQYWDWAGDVVVRFNKNKPDAGTYKVKISVGNNTVGEYASTVLTIKVVNKEVKQSLKVTAKGSIDVLNREGTFIAYTPKLSNLTGAVVNGRLEGKDADMFKAEFKDGSLIVSAQEWKLYSTKVTYEVHTVFEVQTKDWQNYEISSDNAANAKPFKIKVKQGKPKLTAKAVGGSTIYRQRDNSVEFQLSAMLGGQAVEIEDVQKSNYWGDLQVDFDNETDTVCVKLDNPWRCEEIRKNGTYKVKLAVRYRDKASDMKAAEVTVPIVIK